MHRALWQVLGGCRFLELNIQTAELSELRESLSANGIVPNPAGSYGGVDFISEVFL